MMATIIKVYVTHKKFIIVASVFLQNDVQLVAHLNKIFCIFHVQYVSTLLLSKFIYLLSKSVSNLFCIIISAFAQIESLETI